MANYYNKVSTVFWKSGNALFHSCTLHRLYHLSREMRKNLTQEEMQRQVLKMSNLGMNALWNNFIGVSGVTFKDLKTNIKQRGVNI